MHDSPLRAGPGDPPEQRPADAVRLPVCASSDLVDGGAAVLFDVLEYGQPMRAFVLRFDGQPVAYLNRCAHVPVEMDWLPGEFFDAERRYIVCAVHGATYEPADGLCIAGPCPMARLTPVRVAEQDAQVYWYPSASIQPAPAAPPAAASSP